jgi:hypothetical protein
LLTGPEFNESYSTRNQGGTGQTGWDCCIRRGANACREGGQSEQQAATGRHGEAIWPAIRIKRRSDNEARAMRPRASQGNLFAGQTRAWSHRTRGFLRLLGFLFFAIAALFTIGHCAFLLSGCRCGNDDDIIGETKNCREVSVPNRA